ncbi:MAG: MATE family efflux transporter [Candidatus Eisenbacteria bacterium]|uniref:Multidrug-efflux transporter n=1 Tax=Eiseniibacteriota bacterium TaxID=2212470 RepID=A0A538UC72_UNCEI|nr:MAG: MATE family efflux transporter [Candidatus Eisenbacteria bacterium]
MYGPGVETSASPPSAVTDPIPRALLRLAVPAFFSFGLRLAYQWVDALWVRGLGVEATAAVTSSIFVMWWVYSLNDIFAIGITAFVSQLLGAGDRARAGLAAYKGLRASALLGLFGTAAGLLAARPIFGWMGASPGLITRGGDYLSVLLAAAPIPMMALTCESVMRSAGDTRTPLLIDLCAVALNAVLDPILIYGWGPVPALGVRGAAWATVAAQSAMLGGYLVAAARGHRAFPLARRALGPPVRIGRMARVGLPAALIGMLFSVVYIVFARSASRFGAASLAIVGIANRIEAIQFMTGAAIGTAAAALVGQNLGAGRPERAALAIKVGVRWIVLVSVVLTTVVIAFPHAFIGMFTADAEVHRVGAPYLRVLSSCLVFVGVEVVVGEAILGSGHTTAISWIYSSVSLLRIPLAFLVPVWTGLGVLGLAWLITVTCAVRTIAIVAWVARGTWKRGLQHELHAPPAGRPEALGA